MTLLSQLIYKQSHRFNFQNAKYTFRAKPFLTTSYKTFNLQNSVCLHRNNDALDLFSLQNFLTVWIIVRNRSLIHINGSQLGREGSSNSASQGTFINILKYFRLSQLGSTTEIQDGKNTDKHPKTQKLVSIPNANRAEAEKLWQRRIAHFLPLLLLLIEN